MTALPRRGDLAAIATGALGVWMGFHAVRACLTMVVWNVAESLSPNGMGGVAAAVWGVGLLGAIAWRSTGSERGAFRLALLFTILTALRQLFPGEWLSPLFAFAACIAWMWWLPAFAAMLDVRGRGALMATAIALGTIAQLAGLAALHGLDLHMRRDPASTMFALALALAFAVLARISVRRGVAPSLGRRDALERDGSATEGLHEGLSGVGFIAFGAFYFLQLTLLANPGALGARYGWTFPTAIAASIAGIALGMELSRLRARRGPGLVAAVVATLLLVRVEAMPNVAILRVVLVQAALIVMLHAAFTPIRAERRLGAHRGFVAGALVLFAFIFLYYSHADWPLLWPLAAAIAGFVALRARTSNAVRSDVVRLGAAGIAIVGFVIHAATRPEGRALATPAAGELKVLTYNIHQGLDAHSTPAMQRIASEIAALDPDLVALQEVNRGWAISGGVDNVTWLASRFPGYQVLFGPMHGGEFGNAIMTKHRVREWGSDRFTLGASGLPRGYTWARIPTADGDVTIISTHLTPYEQGDSYTERSAQADELATFVGTRSRVIVAGDFNADPKQEPVQRMIRAGLQDVAANRGLNGATGFTWHPLEPRVRIDYIFTTRDIRATKATVPDTDASDHLPVLATLRLR